MFSRMKLTEEFALRLSGPRCVKATPNRAVRVGNTQSAYLMRDSGKDRSNDKWAHTISTPSATQTSKSKIRLVRPVKRTIARSNLQRNQFPSNSEVLERKFLAKNRLFQEQHTVFR